MCFGSTVFTGSEAILCFLTHLGFVASPQYQAKVFLQWLCAVKEMVKPAPHSLEACLWRHSLWTKSEPGSAPQVPTVTSKQGHFCVCGIHSGGEDSATEQRKELNASTTYAKKPSTFISAGMHQQAPLPHDTETRAAGPMLPSPQALPKYYVPPRLNGVRVLPLSNSAVWNPQCISWGPSSLELSLFTFVSQLTADEELLESTSLGPISLLLHLPDGSHSTVVAGRQTGSKQQCF